MQRIVNYGSFMQAYGLKKMINSLGHEVTFIDYRIGALINERKDISKRFKRWFNQTLLWRKVRKYIRKNIWISDKEKLYREDLKRYLNVDNNYRYKEKVDIAVIGSDEVFNCLQQNKDVGFSPALFGKGIRAKKKITYAASFGSTTYKDLEKHGMTKTIRKLLKSIDVISVRDENSKNIVGKLCNNEVPIHLDPVLVSGIENDKWDMVYKKDFLLVYGYSNRFTEREGKYIQEFAHERGLRTIALGDEQKFCDETVICKPSEVISYFKNANYIVTDTFHGSIFSIINHKKFATFIRNKNAGGSTNSEKLEDLLNRLGLSDQIVLNTEELRTILEKSIDYQKVDELRKTETDRSIRYLKDNLIR